ncbi:unnamed protein product [Timema podura]|uniref:Uncharacterized protein n=1 Tax=Timema podura TaxID=61482 RepID=A0ABN7NV82_TIMPD|nr:unnamed protein product [Timema podura]
MSDLLGNAQAMSDERCVKIGVMSNMLKPFQRWTLIRLCSLIPDFVRFSAWLIFTEIALHFVYSNSLLQQPKVVAEMGSWSLYGLGYCMGQFFMLKYVVMYGLMGTIARAENINAPRHPKCIARISLYSDMWRYFDEGLYRFLLRILARKLHTIPVIILLLPGFD